MAGMNGYDTLPIDHLSLEWRTLVAAAMDARERAYAPYSGFRVGAAVRTLSGRTFGGCNVENASYGLTVCAERVAIWKAVSHGEDQIVALAVVSDSGATPCGACRQVMAEFAHDLSVLIAEADAHGRAIILALHDLLPLPFPTVDLAGQGELVVKREDAHRVPPDHQGAPGERRGAAQSE